ncbi:hypothetical protein CRV24_000149 [Beauveria bassiana]|nr:hypothetical protein CRV24_000149 [Beauveria bassiana]
MLKSIVNEIFALENFTSDRLAQYLRCMVQVLLPMTDDGAARDILEQAVQVAHEAKQPCQSVSDFQGKNVYALNQLHQPRSVSRFPQRKPRGSPLPPSTTDSPGTRRATTWPRAAGGWTRPLPWLSTPTRTGSLPRLCKPNGKGWWIRPSQALCHYETSPTHAVLCFLTGNRDLESSRFRVLL